MLHPRCRHPQRSVQDQSNWQNLLCRTLSFPIPSRFIPALSSVSSVLSVAFFLGSSKATLEARRLGSSHRARFERNGIRYTVDGAGAILSHHQFYATINEMLSSPTERTKNNSTCTVLPPVPTSCKKPDATLWKTGVITPGNAGCTHNR